MPGRMKRSQKRVEVEPAVRAARAKVTEKLLAAICPCCGRTIPENRAIKIGYATVDRIGYFESIDWDENKPFGVCYTAGGKGAFKEWEYINPEQAPELFEAVKRRLIDAVNEWINKGWLSTEEVSIR